MVNVLTSLISSQTAKYADREAFRCKTSDNTWQSYTWNAFKEKYKSQLLTHYVADIVANEWHEGGASKVYTAIREDKYSERDF